MTNSASTHSVLEMAIDAVVGMDRTGRITQFNQSAEQMFGRRRDEVLGRQLAEVIIPPNLRSAHEAGLSRYLETGEARILGRRVELVALRSDGTTFPVEIALACGEKGSSDNFTGFIRDITERKESEHFRLLVEAVEDYAIFMLDAGGHVATWNIGAQRFNGYTSEEILGEHVSIFHPLEDRAGTKPQAELDIAAESGRFEDEGWRVRKDGSKFWAKVLITAIRDGEDKLVGFAKVTRDLTERRKAKQLEELEARQRSLELEAENHRMQEANRLKSEFLANMSHELRTPLNAIIGFAELMHKGKVGKVSDDHREYLGDILNSSRHLLKIINDVLDLAKVESGKIELRPEPVEIGKVIAEVTDILRGLASSKRIRIETKVAPSISSAVLDPSKLKQVLYNYLSNALKFTPERGLVTIRVTPEAEDRIRLEIEDTGIGIRPEDTGRLFVEFQQLDAGMAKKYAGTGLGLALTKRIVEAQDGQVGVRSELGKGSTFWAVLPRKAGSVEAMPSLPVSSPRVPSASSGAVVVVDDDPASLRLMEAALRVAGYSAVCFGDGAEALVAIETTTPAAVVLDILMPGIDGFDLLDRLRAMPQMRGVPVVVWTVQDLSLTQRNRLLRSAQRIVPKGEGDNDAVLDALRPYLNANPRGRAHVG
jgi:PAS domain S-box-containing protein